MLRILQGWLWAGPGLRGDALVRAVAANIERGQRDIVNRLEILEKRIMANLDQAIADIQEESTAIDSVGALIISLRQQVADALSGAVLPPAVQAKVDAVFAGLETNKAKLATALATNPDGTPVTPTT